MTIHPALIPDNCAVATGAASGIGLDVVLADRAEAQLEAAASIRRENYGPAA